MASSPSSTSPTSPHSPSAAPLSTHAPPNPPSRRPSDASRRLAELKEQRARAAKEQAEHEERIRQRLNSMPGSAMSGVAASKDDAGDAGRRTDDSRLDNAKADSSSAATATATATGAAPTAPSPTTAGSPTKEAGSTPAGGAAPAPDPAPAAAPAPAPISPLGGRPRADTQVSTASSHHRRRQQQSDQAYQMAELVNDASNRPAVGPLDVAPQMPPSQPYASPTSPSHAASDQHLQPPSEPPVLTDVPAVGTVRNRGNTMNGRSTTGPRSSYYFGPPNRVTAFGTAPRGVIGRDKPREIIRIERDYTGGELCQFHPAFPLELEGRISPTDFANTINDINLLLISAHDPRWGCLDNTFSVLTLYISPLVFPSHYEREMSKLSKFIDRVNKQFFNPAGLNILSPRRVALLFLEIEYY